MSDSPLEAPATPEPATPEPATPELNGPGPEAAPTAEAAAGPEVYYLIDGSGYIFRAFHALPMMTRRADGTPVNAVYGFCTMLIKLLAELKASRVAVLFDASEDTFRKRISPDYKANRAEPPEALVPQFGLIRAATNAFGLPQLEIEGYEADDLIASYCRRARARGAKVVIVSSDKDLMQLVDDDVTMLDPIKTLPIDAAAVREKWGVPPDKMVDLQALAGDATDNVPGVPGIGPKTAAQLIDTYGDLETLLARAGEIKQPKRRQALIDHAEDARLSRRLVRLDDAVDLPLALEDIRIDLADRTKLLAFLREQEFKSIAARVENELYGAGAPGAAVVAEAGPGAAEGPVYELVQDEAALEAWAAEALEAGLVAVDTETDSLNGARAALAGISLCVHPGRACYVPVGHRKPDGLDLDAAEAPRQIPLARALAILKPMLEDPSVLKIGHNLKYDWQILARNGVRPAPSDDSLLLSYVLDGGAHGHGLDELAQLHLNHRTIKYEEVCGSGKHQITFDQVPLERARDYAAEDAEVTRRLFTVLKPRLVPERMATVYETLERPLVAVIGEMEMHGVKVDRARLQRLSTEFSERLATLEAEIHRLAGHPFNVGSPKQLGEVLFGEMGIPGGRKSKGGTYSTDSGVLEVIAAQGHDIARRVLDWRQLAKLKGTYTDALVEDINPRTGRVHTSFSLAATNTGRLSSNEPNLQNIPVRTEEGRKIREAFVPEPGHRLISVDYSQIELRLVAHIAGIATLRQAFRDGIDIHAMTASQVFGVPLAGMTPEIRRRAKTINFGIIYGISPFGLAAQLGIPQSEAKAFIDAYLERFSELKAYMDRTKKECRERGFVTTLYGRKVHIPAIKDPNPARRGFAERQAINAPIQGTAADIIKRAMVRIPGALARAGLTTRMLLQVHDELLLEAPEGEAEQAAALVKQVMEGSASLEVPLVADANIGDSWAAVH